MECENAFDTSFVKVLKRIRKYEGVFGRYGLDGDVVIYLT